MLDCNVDMKRTLKSSGDKDAVRNEASFETQSEVMENPRAFENDEKLDSKKGPRFTTSDKSQTRIVLVTHANVFLYATSFWIQMGALPYLSKKLGANAVIFGYLQTTFAMVQLCGGPFFGRFGDLFGCRAALILAFAASFCSYSLLAFADSVSLLFLSRLPSVVMHSMQGSQMVLTDITANEYRAGALGKLGISYGLGMIVGPFLGGLITSNYSESAAAATAACGSIISIVVVVVFIPANTKILNASGSDNTDNSKEAKSEEKASVFNFSRILATLKIPNVAYLLAIKCICGIPFGIFTSMFSIMTMDHFKLGPKGNGFILSYVGILGSLVQGFGVGLLTKRFKDSTLLSWSVVMITFAYFLMIPVQSVYTFCLVLTPLIAGGSVLQVVITSSITKMVYYQETGAAIGLSMATHSLIRAMSPTIGGILFSNYGFPSFGITGLLINGVLSFYLLVYGKAEF